MVWFWDDNLTINRNYIHALLTELKPLKKWWLTQASLDIAKDDKLLDMMRDSGCIGVFLGIESFDKESLADAPGGYVPFPVHEQLLYVQATEEELSRGHE